MSHSRSRLLFLSHSASRNGASILLLHLLRWLRKQEDYDVHVLVNGRGPLVPEFRSVGSTRVWRSPFFFMDLLRGWGAQTRSRLEARYLKTFFARRRYDLVYANTTAIWQHVPLLAQQSRSLLWHIHELGYAVQLTMRGGAWQETFSLAKRFIAVSQSVKEALTNDFKVPSEKVDLVHEFIPRLDLVREEYQAKRQRIRRELGIGENAFVLGGCGSLGWRKGTDLFLQVAHALRQQGEQDTRFLWVGGEEKGGSALEFSHDSRLLELQDCCARVPNTPRALDFYCAMDVFALTSREDPFPLVMLEAGAHKLPIVCFARSGGGPEFVGQSAGLIAPYLNIQEFATHIMTLKKNPDLLTRMGHEAARRVEASHTVEGQAPKILASIQHCLGSN